MNFKETTILGRTGLAVSRMGLASGYGINATAVEKAFREHGVNYFVWGNPRRKGMGEGLRTLARTDRDQLVIALQTYDHWGPFIQGGVEKGLRALGTDHVEVLVLGWFNRPPKGRLLENALKLKEQGKVRFLAMSGHERKTFGAMAKDPKSPVDVYMIGYNAVHTGAETDIFPHLPKDDQRRPGITIYTATCWRKLLKQNKMPPGEKPMTAAECYRFVLSNPNVDLTLFAPNSEQQMLDGLKALDQGPLSEEEMAQARRIGKHIHGEGLKAEG
jgi:aryl-alcohol dehydrogenase-like predicted oxidoreductase